MKKNKNRRIKQKSPVNISGGFVNDYILPVRPYIFVSLILAFVLRVVITMNSGAIVAMTKVGGYDWLIAIVVAGMYGFIKYKQKLTSVILHSIVMGLVFGVIVSIIDMLIIRDLWAFSNIIKKPLIISCIFGAVSSIGFVIRKNGN